MSSSLHRDGSTAIRERAMVMAANELMAEHRRLRDAAQAFVDAALNPFDSGEQEFARLRAVLADTTTGSEENDG